jgi:S1-C subfamily serine protease
VVRVLGTACGLGVEGSDLVVTNAHVIAGSDDTTVTTQEGIEQEAEPVYFAPADDLALLRVEDELDPLPLVVETRAGTPGAVLGYPENGPFAVSPARLGETRSVISEDAYGNGPLERSIASLRGEVRSGNSGGPMVDDAGRVLGTVFAATTSGPKGGFAIPNEAVYRALDGATGEVGTGSCSH